jgi:hypothetical protein
MDGKIIATYCLCDDLLKAMHHHTESQCKMSDAEVMTMALTATLCFRGTLESTRVMLTQHGYIPQMLSKSHFSRRLHHLKETLMFLFNLLGAVWKRLSDNGLKVHLLITKARQPVEFFSSTEEALVMWTL